MTTVPGSVDDTYAAAIQHGQVDVSDADLVLGVVRKPLPWFHGAVDENRRALGPPAELLDDLDDRMDELVEDGIDEATAHDRAWEETDFDRRYREYLRTDEEGRRAVSELRERIADGEDVVLVCYENTDEKRCHRTTLARAITESGEDR